MPPPPSTGLDPSIRAELSRPDAYPAPQPTRIDCVETHISCVFLADGEVYKIKKPVDFGFLDYRSLDRRRHFCEEEVRLNERLAPGVYLGVEAVRRGADGRARLGGDGQVV